MSEPGKVDSTKKTKFSWRDGLKVMGAVGGSLIAVELADMMLLRGFITTHLLRAKNDPDYRDRLINTIKQGRIDDKLKMEVEERIRPYSEVCALGEPLNYREGVLDKGFERYEVRQFITGGEITNNLLLVANIGSNVRTYQTERSPKEDMSLSQTMDRSGNFFTIPSSYVTIRNQEGKFDYLLDSFCSYEVNGKVETQGEDKVDYTSGAIVLFDNGMIRVVDRLDILNYQVGKNHCTGIQSYGIAINSDTAEDDIKSLEWTSYSTGGNAARSRDQAAFIMTLSDSEDPDREESLILSVYQHCDSQNGQVSGNEWQLGLSMEQTVGMCEQLALERKYDKFVLVGPDPNRYHSRINGPADLEDSDVSSKILRRFNYWEEPLFREGEGATFAPPFFLGIALDSNNNLN